MTTGMPRLETSTTTSYHAIWNDKGSGAGEDGGFWQPIAPEGFFIIGGYGQQDHHAPRDSVVVVKVVGDDSREPLLAAPQDWTRIWRDKGSGAKEDGSFWRPRPPSGYIALGDCAAKGWDSAPPSDVFRCVHHDLVVPFGDVIRIWWDKGSGADKDLTVWRIGRTNVIHTEAAHRETPIDPIYILKER